MAAVISKDSFRASEWHLYYPQHLLDEKLEPYAVPVAYYYYSQEPNYEVDISDVLKMKIKAAASHVSQFEPSITKYTPEMPKETFEEIRVGFTKMHTDGDRFVERFRREVSP